METKVIFQPQKIFTSVYKKHSDRVYLKFRKVDPVYFP